MFLVRLHKPTNEHLKTGAVPDSHTRNDEVVMKAIACIRSSSIGCTLVHMIASKLYGFQADVIECILAQCHETGVALPDDVEKDKQKCLDAIRRFVDEWDVAMHCLNRCYVPCELRLLTQNAIDYLHFVYATT